MRPSHPAIFNMKLITIFISTASGALVVDGVSDIYTIYISGDRFECVKLYNGVEPDQTRPVLQQPFITSSSALHHQFFISSSSALHQFLISFSSVLYQFFISSSSLLYQFFISFSSVLCQFFISKKLCNILRAEGAKADDLRPTIDARLSLLHLFSLFCVLK